MDRLVKVARHDSRVTHAFMRVLNLLEPPSTLLAPAMAARVLRPKATREPQTGTKPVSSVVRAQVKPST